MDQPHSDSGGMICQHGLKNGLDSQGKILLILNSRSVILTIICGIAPKIFPKAVFHPLPGTYAITFARANYPFVSMWF